jgi:hypothetical protein
VKLLNVAGRRASKQSTSTVIRSRLADPVFFGRPPTPPVNQSLTIYCTLSQSARIGHPRFLTLTASRSDPLS